jgi:hypothetical protein
MTGLVGCQQVRANLHFWSQLVVSEWRQTTHSRRSDSGYCNDRFRSTAAARPVGSMIIQARGDFKLSYIFH